MTGSMVLSGILTTVIELKLNSSEIINVSIGFILVKSANLPTPARVYTWTVWYLDLSNVISSERDKAGIAEILDLFSGKK